MHLPSLHIFPSSQQFFFQICWLNLHDILELCDVIDITCYFFILLVEELHHSKKIHLFVLVLKPYSVKSFHFELSVDLDVMNHLVGLIKAVLFRHLLQHLFILLKKLHGDVIFGVSRNEADLSLHLDQTPTEH